MEKKRSRFSDGVFLPSSVIYLYYIRQSFYHQFVLFFPLFLAQRRDSSLAQTTRPWRDGRRFYRPLATSSICFSVRPPWEPSLDSFRHLYPHLCWVSVTCFCFLCLWFPLTHLSVPQTLWPEKDSFSRVRHDDNICVPSVRPGWRH